MVASLDDFTGTHIYIDTMLLYTLLHAEPRVRPIVQRLFSRIESGKILAYTSVLSFDELAYRLILALIKERYGGSPQDHLRAREAEILKELAPAIIPRLQMLRTFPNLSVLEISSHDVDAMLQNMVDYPMKPRDALHLATMQRVRCLDLASNDHHFDKIPEIRRFSVT
jgi:predicted nucleic acid-binding protein